MGLQPMRIHLPPRGHRYINTNVMINVTDENNDNFQFRSLFDVNIIWDSPGSGIVRHRYSVLDLNVTGRAGLIILENTMVPVQGSIELIVYPENPNGEQNMAIMRGGIPGGSVSGRCGINTRRGRSLRVQASQVSLSGSRSESANSSTSNGQSASLGGGYGGVNIGGQASRGSSRGRGSSQTRSNPLGLGRFDMSQIS